MIYGGIVMEMRGDDGRVGNRSIKSKCKNVNGREMYLRMSHLGGFISDD